MTAAPTKVFAVTNCNRKAPESESATFLIHRHCEIINICCLQLLSLEIICNAAMDNTYMWSLNCQYRKIFVQNYHLLQYVILIMYRSCILNLCVCIYRNNTILLFVKYYFSYECHTSGEIICQYFGNKFICYNSRKLF